jgi:hypothetical protein
MYKTVIWSSFRPCSAIVQKLTKPNTFFKIVYLFIMEIIVEKVVGPFKIIIFRVYVGMVRVSENIWAQ